jgi:ArsR family transcriptional regulator
MMTQMNKQQNERQNTASCCGDVADLMQPGFFKALSDPNRIAILARLAKCCQACTVSEIAECCPINVSVVSRHLAMLRDAGILEARKKGKEVYYTVRYASLAKGLRQIADAFDACSATEVVAAKTTKKATKSRTKK